MARVIVDPVTRIEGHLRIEAVVENGVITDAFSAGTMVRGLEKILIGRDPRDIENHWQNMYALSSFCGAMGAEMRAISALDVALWDLVGQIAGLPIYFPEDKAIPVKATPAPKQFTRTFKRDKKNLQREQKPGVSPLLAIGAYLVVLVIFVFLYGSMGWGLALLQQRLGTRAVRV